MSFYSLDRSRDNGRRLFGRTRPPQVEACVVSADAPGGAISARVIICALFVKLGAELVPELVTSTRSRGCVAVIAWSAGKGSSRGGCARSIGCCELVYMSRAWVRIARHVWPQLRIPWRTRLLYNCDMSRDLCELRFRQQECPESFGGGRARTEKARTSCEGTRFLRSGRCAFICHGAERVTRSCGCVEHSRKERRRPSTEQVAYPRPGL